MDPIYETSDESYKMPKRSPFADSPYEFQHTYSEAAPERKQRPGKPASRKGRKVLAILCAAALLLGACGATAAIVGFRYENRMELMNLAAQQRLDAMQQQLDDMKNFGGGNSIQAPAQTGMTPQEIYARNAKAVVLVTATGLVTDESGKTVTGTSYGSGFLISQDGYLVTNYHVIQGMTELGIVLQDGTKLAAALVGGDASADIAVLKVEGEDLPYVTIGSSDALNVGEQVLVIGYPLSSTSPILTVGYVSCKNQTMSTDGTVSHMLQTDAAVNSGNSGGPLLNTAGQVVGINTAKFSGYSTSGASIEGMSLAIPMDDVVGMIWDLKEYGYITGAYLGVYVRDVDSHVQMYGLPAGAYVESTVAGMSADRGGIKTGDVITVLGGYDVECVSDLTRALRRFSAGDTVSVTVWRNGRQQLLSVVLDEKPQETLPQETLPQETQPQETQPQQPGFEPAYPELPFGDIWDYFSKIFPYFGG